MNIWAGLSVNMRARLSVRVEVGWDESECVGCAGKRGSITLLGVVVPLA